MCNNPNTWCIWGSTLKKEVQGTLSIFMDLPKDSPLRKNLEQYKTRFEDSLEESLCSIYVVHWHFNWYIYVLIGWADVAWGWMAFHPWRTWSISRTNWSKLWLVLKRKLPCAFFGMHEKRNWWICWALCQVNAMKIVKAKAKAVISEIKKRSKWANTLGVNLGIPIACHTHMLINYLDLALLSKAVIFYT